MGNVASKIINAVAESYNGSAKVKYNRKTYGAVNPPLANDNATAIVNQLNAALSTRYSGVNWT